MSQAEQMEATKLVGLAHILVNENVIEDHTARALLRDANKAKEPFVNYLCDHTAITAADIARISAKSFGLPLLDLKSYDQDLLPMDLFSERLINEHHALPLFKRNDNLYLAIADPSQYQAMKDFKFQTGLSIHPIVVEADKLRKLIEMALNKREDAALDNVLNDETLDAVNISSQDKHDDEDEDASPDDAPIVRFVNKILLDAVKMGASDIHFEPYENSYRVRFRIDGLLHEVTAPPVNLASRIASRLKILAELDISERRVPQDGRFMMKLSRKHKIDFRVNTCPTVSGEKVVMRILDPTASNYDIDSLGFNELQKKRFLDAINQPQGMVLVTGPTGSGKTITLYTALSLLNTPEKNISTAEDPVEIKLTGVNQVNINLKAGLTFANSLRAFLRQDPDIIMVGEIRDLETAEIGIKAAQTGHLVLSTLHTNSSAETLTRLMNMGVETFNIASSVSLIIAQRLARRLCNECKKPLELPKTALVEAGFTEEQIEGATLFQAHGCDHCTHGYKGRIGLYEVMPVTRRIGEIIMRGGTALDIEKAAKENQVTSVREAGLAKVAAGITTIDEINRVTKD